MYAKDGAVNSHGFDNGTLERDAKDGMMAEKRRYDDRKDTYSYNPHV